MSNTTLILGYVLFSLLFLIASGTLLYKRRRENENTFRTHYPRLLEYLEKGNLTEAFKELEIVAWNPNMTKHYYNDILKLLNGHEEESTEYNAMVNLIKSVFERKGWNAL